MSYYFIKFLFCDINWCSFCLSEARNPDSLQGSLLNLKTLSSLGKTAFLHYCSITHLCLTLCDLMDWSSPGFSVLHCLPELAQTHAHWAGDAIQPSHPLSSPSSPALNLSQHQGLFQWVGSLHQVAKVLEFQHQSFQWIFRVDFLWAWWVWSPCCPKDSQESLAPQVKIIWFLTA